MKQNKLKYIFFLVAAMIGLVISGYSIWAHYDTGDHGVCEISSTFSCDGVNQSSYSEILGVPVAVLGFVAYLFFFVGLLIYSKNKNQTLGNLMTAGLILGFGFSCYLTFLEAFVIFTWCILCLTQHLMMFIMLVLMLWIRRSSEFVPLETNQPIKK